MRPRISFNCIIIDDDDYAISRLSEYIAVTENLELVGAYANAEVAEQKIRNGPDIDFLFLDIEMPGISGIELAKLVGDKARFCIFVSGHLERVIETFDVEATHFILKPFTLKKFQETINTVLKRGIKTAVEKPYILIKCNPNTQILKIYHDVIVVVEGASNYVKIHTIDKIYITYRKMMDMETELGARFLRISRSFIIAERHIQKVEDGYVYMFNDMEVKIGSTYKKKITDYMNSRIGS